jgi:hypothetical protein
VNRLLQRHANQKFARLIIVTISLALSAGALTQAYAADTPPSDQLQEVVVTGSLIPQTEKETAASTTSRTTF